MLRRVVSPYVRTHPLLQQRGLVRVAIGVIMNRDFISAIFHPESCPEEVINENTREHHQEVQYLQVEVNTAVMMMMMMMIFSH